MAPPSSSSSSPPLPSRRSHLFTPIQEGNESEETDELHHHHHRVESTTTPSSANTDTHNHQHQPTPLHNKKPTKSHTVSCTDCRPTTREQKTTTIVPINTHNNTTTTNNDKHSHSHSRHSFSSSSPSPSPNNGLFKSLLSSISHHRRSPKPESSSSSSAPDKDQHWKAAVAELSRKLVHATRRRDDAILESSKLKQSMAELEKKLNRLEVYCLKLKSGLDSCGYNHQPMIPSPARSSPHYNNNNSQLRGVVENYSANSNDMIIKCFLVSVSEARSSIRFLSKSLTSQLKLMGVKVFERLSGALRGFDVRLSSSVNPKTLQLYLEALLNGLFYLEFESSGFEKNSITRVLNPIERAELNYMDYTGLKDLAWEEVLSKGTKHFSEEFSKFCDRKMSEVVSMLGWNRAWPEQLLQAFFVASKSVWLVHLLANSVHPTLTIFRVEKGARFDPVYMEDMGADKAKKLLPAMVRIMVTPGFYVYDNVVKCKVISKYCDSNYSVFNGNGEDDNRFVVPSP